MLANEVKMFLLFFLSLLIFLISNNPANAIAAYIDLIPAYTILIISFTIANLDDITLVIYY